MQTIQVEYKNGYYSCDIGITKGEWLEILKDANISDNFKDVLLRFYYMPEHRGSCTAVSKRFGGNPRTLNIIISKFGNRIRNLFKDRFEVVGVNGDFKRWIIPMNKGKYLSKDDEGSFEWEVRSELVEAIKEYLYWYLVERYKELRKNNPLHTNEQDELYKWQLVTRNQGKTPLEIVEGGLKNLIDQRHDVKTLKYLLTNKREDYDKVLARLVNEEIPLEQRLAYFKQDVKILLPITGYNSKANDERTAASILTCYNPKKYTFYKHNLMYDRFCMFMGVLEKKPGLCYSHYLQLLVPLAQLAANDTTLQLELNDQLSGMVKSDLLLAQDIIWMLLACGSQERTGFIFNILFPTKENHNEMKTTSKYEKYIELLETNKNLIFTGAPGTGKTFMAKAIAEEMGAEVGFVQFHPSYDYTDFVEGLRPTRENQNGVIGFKRQDGVFKEFCKKAIFSETADEETMSDINSNPTVWKVSLEGTGDNPTRKDCMENGYIRIGWQQYGDIDDFNDYVNYYDGGKNPLRAFQSGMQIGDLVVSCYTAKEIDAVGVVTGDYEYRVEGGEYPRYRSVRWLVKNIRENIVEQNKGKTFTLPTVYKAKITAEAALKIVQKYVGTSKKEIRQDKFIFIIDEINRGEISKIFGELFFSIDPGYRGEKGRVCTQYQNMIEEGDVFKEGFYVPENVYIIGTMNDIDRSVESMDFAMRRRFTWKEIRPADTEYMLDTLDCAAEAKASMHRLNNAIEETDGLGAAYMIGPAYFLKVGENGGDFNKLWKMNIEPLLKEYLRGFRKAKGILDKFSKAYYNQIDED